LTKEPMTADELREEVAARIFLYSDYINCLSDWSDMSKKKRQKWHRIADQVLPTFLRFCDENDARVVITRKLEDGSTLSGYEPLSSMFKEARWKRK